MSSYRDAFFAASLFTTSLGFRTDDFGYSEDRVMSPEERSLLDFATEAWFASQEPTEFAFAPLRVSIAMQGILKDLLAIRTQLSCGSLVHGAREYFTFTKDDVRRSLLKRNVTRAFHTWLTTEGMETIEFTFQLAYGIANNLHVDFRGATVSSAENSHHLHPVILGRDILYRLGAARLYGRIDEVKDL